MKNEAVQELLSNKEIEEVMNPRNYLGTAFEQIELVVKKTRQERRARGLPVWSRFFEAKKGDLVMFFICAVFTS